MTGRVMVSAILCVLLAAGGALARRGPVKGINYAGKWRNAQWLRGKYRDHAPFMTRIDGKYVDTQRYTSFNVSGEVFQVLSKDEMLFDCRGIYRFKKDQLTRRIYVKGGATKGLTGSWDDVDGTVTVSLINSMKVWHMGSHKYKNVLGQNVSVSKCVLAVEITEDDFLDALEAGFELVRWEYDRKKGWVSEPDL